MKRLSSASTTAGISAKKSKKDKSFTHVDFEFIEKSREFDEIFAGLNYTLQKASTSKTSEHVAKKFDKFTNEFESLQSKINKMEKENSIMFSIVDRVLEDGDVSGEDVMLIKSEYCNYCNLTLANKRYFYAHMVERHTLHLHRYIACVLCNARCTDMDALDRHVKTHSADSICKLCNEEKPDMSDHIFNAHGYDGVGYLQLGCDFCSYRTNSCTSLQLHCFLCSNNPTNSNYTPTEEGRVCNLCHQVFTTNLQMLRHKESKHQHGHDDGGNLRNFVCEECGQSFFSIRSLGGHKRKHSRKKGALEGMVIPASVNIGLMLEPKIRLSDRMVNDCRKFEKHELEDMPDL
ncbi:unnamed protein product [Bursaphelenchus xylophilus]|uniref:(pine wood nematode) hypothetical protein n=1 Tax=Bursaphelenchus xylophilus TaxID=6326 RepID=A0A1I7STK0_BURXY|nr:unnamed protein product [Bursaphelenchus xylophilus]CAG9108312.1 unnamed protein product [Bursaphelenchus xylophilus]